MDTSPKLKKKSTLATPHNNEEACHVLLKLFYHKNMN